MEKSDITVLVVEDEADILTLLLFQLRKDGFEALGAATGEEGLRLVREKHPQLVILDRMLPGMDGTAVCRKIRSDAAIAATPVLMLTARGSEEDTVSGFEAGADDYVTKPFSNRVLLARVRSLLRRSGRLDSDPAGEDTLAVGDIELCPERREVTVRGTKVELTAGEFKMLQVMMRRPGIVFARDQLLDMVHGSLHAVTERAVDVQVVGLRKKLGAAGSHIETVRGAGYRIAVGG